ncbi:MAG: LysR substrate-binding domain-containing protein [Gammaproteobacteria bacterium]|nr:LysR substrate-binding domain-containing protein [Gammaproteobacteria bacterium]
MAVQFRGLRAFCLAAQHLSFKQAADELCLTASAVSHQIRDLESHLGVRLFERRTRAIVLTDDGSALYREVHPHLRAIEQAAGRLRDRPNRAPLLVRMPEFFASELFMPRVGAFSEANRHIDLRIETTGPGESMSERADVSIVLTDNPPPHPRTEQLFPIRYVPACSPELHARYSRQGHDALEQATLLLHQGRPEAWHQWADLAGVRSPPPRQIIRLDSMFALARAAERGVGIALIPMPLSQSWFQSGTLLRLFRQDLQSTDSYYVISRSDSDHPDAANVLWHWIVEEFAERDQESAAA